MSEGCHRNLWSECVMLFKAIQQKYWNSYTAGVLEVVSASCWPLMTSRFSVFPVCLFVPTQVLSQVINLMDNQKNCAANSDYKGYWREEIFCWVVQWYIWVTEDEALLFQDLLKVRKGSSFIALQLVRLLCVCMNSELYIRHFAHLENVRGSEVQAQKILQEPNNNLSKSTL